MSEESFFFKKKYILGLKKFQIGLVYFLSALTYFFCTFFVPFTNRFIYKDVRWKDVITLLILIVSWILLIVYNHHNPDEEIKLNLTDDESKFGNHSLKK